MSALGVGGCAAAGVHGAGPDGSGANAAGGLQQAERLARERGRVDGRHPDARLVDLEQVRDERVEVDVRVGEVVEGQFLPVPIKRG